MPIARVIWDGEPKGWAGKTTSGKTGHLVLNLVATRRIGIDEELKEYNVTVVGEPNPVTRTTYNGQRVRTISVRAEAYDEDEGFDILEAIRLQLGHDDTGELFNAAGLAFNSTEDVVNLGGSAGNRAVTFASMDVKFNQMVQRVVISTNPADTYIDTVEMSGDPELDAITTFDVTST